MISRGELMPLTLSTVAVLVEDQSMPLIESAVTCRCGALMAPTDRKESAVKPPLLESQLSLDAEDADGTRTERTTWGDPPAGCCGERTGYLPWVRDSSAVSASHSRALSRPTCIGASSEYWPFPAAVCWCSFSAVAMRVF